MSQPTTKKLLHEKDQKIAQLEQALAIEAALERVRSRSMAMQQSDELSEVAQVLFKELSKLNLTIFQTYISIISEDEKSLEIWLTGFEGEYYPQKLTLLVDNFPFLKNLMNKWRKGMLFNEYSFKGAAVKEWFELLYNLTKNDIYIVKQYPEAVFNLEAMHKHGAVCITTQQEAAPEAKSILARFAKVFEQSLIRFLDLQKAEAQAREAQIEVALERVRASTMAMHHSSDLTESAAVLFEQIKLLGAKVFSCGFVLCEENNPLDEQWMSVGNSKELIQQYIPHEEEPHHLNMYKAWQTGEALLVQKIEGEALQAAFAFLTAQPSVQKNLEKIIDKNTSFPSIQVLHAAYFSQGYLLIVTTEAYPEKDIFIRFAKVFEQTYTRFLDLQKAEMQARKAQIETSIERIRTKALAMHHSQEIQEVAKVIRGELRKLGVTDILSTGIWIEHQQGQFRAWDISTIPETESQDFLLEFTYEIAAAKRHPKAHFWNIMYQNKDYFTTQSDKVTLYASFNWLAEFDKNTAKELIQLVDTGYLKHWWHAVAAFEKGVIVVDFNEEPPAEMATILPKMAAAFDLAYRRFEDLETAEAQKQKIEKVFNENQRLLHSILPEQIAEQIRAGQQSIVKRFEQVSILFADIVGFTILSEKLSPQEVVDILNGLFSKFDDLTDKYGLEKIKTIGDAYMVASGVPEEKANHAHVLFQFAQDMLQAIQNFNQAVGTQLKIRIGISSGPVVAGVIGKKKFAYDLWGDSVNTAARMEAYGQASCIQLSPTSYEILKNDFEFEKIPKVAIKGKGLMDVYVWRIMG